MLIYDIEIVKAIPPKDDKERLPDIEYCAGWHDHAGMGVSVIGAYDYVEDRYRTFCQDNFDEFRDLIECHDQIVGFNSIPFDNQVCRVADVADIPEEKSYDILREVWAGAGLGPVFSYPAHVGFSLDACMQ